MDLLIIFLLSLGLRSVKGQLIFFFFGAIFSLGPAEITPAKVLYLILLILTSISQVKRIQSNGQFSDYTQSCSAVFNSVVIFLIFESVISLSLKLSPLSIMRSYLPFILFLLALPILFRASRVISETFLSITILTLGNLSAFSVWFVWSQRHGLNDFSIERIALDADWLAFLGLIYALHWKTINPKHRFIREISKISIPLFLILSLSRTNLILVLFIFAFHFISSKMKSLASWAYLIVCSILLAVIIKWALIIPDSLIYRRFSSTFYLFKSGGFSDQGLGTDLSISLRRQQAEVARKIFLDFPLSGTGIIPENQTFDTLWASLMQFGLIGCALYSIAILLLILQVYRSNTSFKKQCLSYFALLIPASFIYNWPSNKSFWFGNSLIYVLITLVSNEKNIAHLKK